MRQKRTYGRHGPDAWLRQHKRRFRSRPPVLAHTPSIRIVRFPMERIIIIMVDNTFTGSEDAGARGWLPEGENPFHLIMYYAEVDAEKKAENDLLWSDLSSDEELLRYTESLWGQQYVRQSEVIRIASVTKKRSRELFDIYKDTFISNYHEELQKAEASRPEEPRRSIERAAREDKKSYGASLTPKYLFALAVVRVQQQLPLGATVDLEFLEQVVTYVDIYHNTYRDFVVPQEKERL